MFTAVSFDSTVKSLWRTMSAASFAMRTTLIFNCSRSNSYWVVSTEFSFLNVRDMYLFHYTTKYKLLQHFMLGKSMKKTDFIKKTKKYKKILTFFQKGIAFLKKVWYNNKVVKNKAHWSSGQDASLSRWKLGFDSRMGHQQKTKSNTLVFDFCFLNEAHLRCVKSLR